MDTSAPAWPPRRRALGLLNTVLVVTLVALPSPGLSSDCTPSINIPGNQLKLSQTKEKTFSLRCLVRLCSQGLPNVTWCRIGLEQNNQCQPVIADNRIFLGWENTKKEVEAVHVLKFLFMHLNESGLYRCSASYNGMEIVGRAININFSVFSPDQVMAKTANKDMPSYNSTDSTSVPTIPPLDQFKILVYFMASAGGLCLIIIITSLLVFWLRRRRGKSGSSTNPENAEEVQFAAAPVSPENCLELSEVSCPPGKEFTTVPTETTYDNAHLGYRPSQPPSQEEDSIVYADLNHDVKKAHIQFEAETEVEYAMVHLK